MKRAARRSLKLAEAATLKLASTQAVTSARARLLSRVGRQVEISCGAGQGGILCPHTHTSATICLVSFEYE